MLIDQIYQALVNQANENSKRKDEYGIYLSEKLMIENDCFYLMKQETYQKLLI
nr:hypothetical protein [Mycoplasmopsis bovis]